MIDQLINISILSVGINDSGERVGTRVALVAQDDSGIQVGRDEVGTRLANWSPQGGGDDGWVIEYMEVRDGMRRAQKRGNRWLAWLLCHRREARRPPEVPRHSEGRLLSEGVIY